jgi:hypothetical protein
MPDMPVHESSEHAQDGQVLWCLFLYCVLFGMQGPHLLLTRIRTAKRSARVRTPSRASANILIHVRQAVHQRAWMQCYLIASLSGSFKEAFARPYPGADSEEICEGAVTDAGQGVSEHAEHGGQLVLLIDIGQAVRECECDRCGQRWLRADSRVDEGR